MRGALVVVGGGRIGSAVLREVPGREGRVPGMLIPVATTLAKVEGTLVKVEGTLAEVEGTLAEVEGTLAEVEGTPTAVGGGGAGSADLCGVLGWAGCGHGTLETLNGDVTGSAGFCCEAASTLFSPSRIGDNVDEILTITFSATISASLSLSMGG